MKSLEGFHLKPKTIRTNKSFWTPIVVCVFLHATGSAQKKQRTNILMIMDIESQGMILMAEDHDGKLRLIQPNEVTQNGMGIS
ncbi:hypothetical protein N7E81_11305 [Reichenbachiella carrageenanivorans]|uniref:Uncharacterized protein n=1 Tax=Reichenbachiella carrageenanivorans TaxID=2979869 RepID=A0ABY6CVL8_9BACT|nr:hypothetical protein [Reichenbachiella carrageenanivorans]UXX77952.1 hypothetical protein N7E81_11305 [Reichenbachiella carrageenanivorans]